MPLTPGLATKKKEEKPPLRQLLLDGDFFVATPLAGCLAKLGMKAQAEETLTDDERRHVGTEFFHFL